MTSIENVFEQLEEQGLVFKSANNLLHISISASDYLDIKRLAKEMHKQEIIDAYNKSFELRDKPYSIADKYYQETFVSKGSGDTFKVCECCGMEECICNDQDDDALTDDEWIIKQKHQQITTTAMEFAKWLASNWIPLHVTKEYLWEYDELDLSKIPQDYRGYKTEKQLFNIFQSLKQPKQ